MPLVQNDLLHGRYRILEVLGHGGMGSVYRAHDERLSVDVAVKENLFTTEDYARQFRLEATILASLRHPNLPRVSDHFVLEDEGQYLVMDYIEGQDLRQVLEKNGPITEEEAIRIGLAICDALIYLHSRNPAILHRDIKLGNIKLVRDGSIVLVDFGLAKIIEGDQQTMTGARAMTPGYSPPEQYGSARTDARSDIYSLGATLYAALTGFIPEDSLSRALDGVALTPLRKRAPKISERLARVIEKAMETTPANRYQSAQAFKEALLGDQPVPVYQQPISQPTPPVSPAPRPKNDPQPAQSEPPVRKTIPGRVFLFAGLVLALVISGLFLTSPAFFPLEAASLTAVTATTPTVDSPPLVPVEPASPTPTEPPTMTATSVIVATQTATPTNTPQPTTPPLPQSTPLGGGAGQIVFVSTRSGLPEIYTMNPDGSNQQRLFTEPEGACQPRWSPDGTKIAYISPCEKRQNEYPNSIIKIYDLASSDSYSLAGQLIGGNFDPAWSPDGLQIAYTSLSSGFSQIYILPVKPPSTNSNSNQTPTVEAPFQLVVTDSTRPARQPVWQPDGSGLVYNLQRSGMWQLWKISASGENAEQILRSGAGINDFRPAISPDGTLVYFNQTGTDLNIPPSLMIFAFGQDRASRISNDFYIRDLSVSPDGNWLIAAGIRNTSLKIVLFDLANNLSTVLTENDPGMDFDPHWRP